MRAAKLSAILAASALLLFLVFFGGRTVIYSLTTRRVVAEGRSRISHFLESGHNFGFSEKLAKEYGLQDRFYPDFSFQPYYRGHGGVIESTEDEWNLTIVHEVWLKQDNTVKRYLVMQFFYPYEPRWALVSKGQVKDDGHWKMQWVPFDVSRP